MGVNIWILYESPSFQTILTPNFPVILFHVDGLLHPTTNRIIS